MAGSSSACPPGRRSLMQSPCQPERIVLCIDACDDRSRFPGQQPGKHYSTVSTIKKCAEAFILNKASMNSNHQFALLVFKMGVFYMSNFHNKTAEHLKQLHNIAPNISSDQPTPLGRIFQTVYDKVFKNVDDEKDEQLEPLRIVLFYGRSGTCVMDDNVLANHKNVITDVLFIHRPVLSAKANKRLIANLTELKACLSDKSLCCVALSDSPLALKYMAKFLIHPNLRYPCAKVNKE